ncbi:protein Asterix isoform X2 [Boleophthalmus pectinirostris]|uniref:protein Asterix isoform X2 n=1 Tax=Boleophthalmus pectinirostris TaxID=150288 RepID=UPI00242FD139|nr:protein Asterix isoform X2 [Boleophthalmus pectinirostris]
MSSNNMSDPRRQNKILRYKPPSTETNPTLEDPTPDYMNLLGMIFSMCGLMLKVVHLCGRHVLPPKPAAHVSALVTPPPHGPIGTSRIN